ncbi:hypothetical protein KAX75_02700 [candidate division WOR-3 bacterium]|nr:hypothetical protein [candidate division WOR-3 bacterium]
MKNLTVLFLLFLLLPILVSAETPYVKKNFLLSKNKAGRIEIGMTIDNLYSKYNKKLTKLVDLYLEGMFSPALEIYLSKEEGEENKPSLVAEIGFNSQSSKNEFIVSRINVYDNAFKTEKGVGVGSTLGELRNAHQVNWIEFGESGLIARVNELEMSFVLFLINIPEQWYLTRDMELIPDSVKILSVLMN